SFLLRPPSGPTLFPYTTLFRSLQQNSPEFQEQHLLLLVHFLQPLEQLFLPQPPLPELQTPLLEPLLAPHFSFSRLQHVLLSLFRSEEHTSELQSRENLVCRLLL